MTFSYNWLQEYIKTKLPAPEKLADLLSLHAFEAEVPKKIKDDWILDIDILPNRAHDCLCHTGVAREIAAIQKTKLKTSKTKRIQAQKGDLQKLDVRVQNTNLVPRYTALVVEGVKVGKSPQWLRERLEAVGVNSINNIVDLTNFVMLELGQPMHAFDYDQIQGHLMNIRGAQKGEKLKTLDDQVLSLFQGALVIEDKNRLIDLAGIKGGKVSGISMNTRNIVFQAANFNAKQIYQTKAQLTFSTQAADVYAHDISPELTMWALKRASFLLSELGINGKIVQIIDLYPKKAKQKRITLDLAYAESLLNIPVSLKEAKATLERLECHVTRRKNRLEVEVPARRLDLEIPEDLVEEIGRIHGYEQIQSTLPLVPIVPPEPNFDLLWQENVRNIFKGLGFTEVYNYSFRGTKDFAQFAYSEKEKQNLVALENPISQDFSHLRDTLVENLLKNVRDNQKQSKTIRVFEMGKVFHAAKKGVEEASMLSAVVADGNFYEMKGICDFLFQSLGILNVWYDDYEATSDKNRAFLWQKGKSAELKVDNQELGFLGETSDNVRSALKIAKPLSMLQMNVDKLIALATEERAFQAPSRFPSSVRDIAVLVPLDTKVSELMNAMNTQGDELIEDIDLFDMYTGEEIGEGRKNLAFHIVYQSNKKTLTNKEVDTLHRNIIKVIEENPEWEVRK